jgi:carbon starvation protein
VYPKFDKTDWMPGAVLSTALVVAGWGGLIWSGSIETIWPMFGIANQMLAVIALVVVTTVMFNAGRGRYAPITILPLIFVTGTTLTAGYQMIAGRFAKQISDGWALGGLNGTLVQGVLNAGLIVLLIGSTVIIMSQAITRWTAVWRAEGQ